VDGIRNTELYEIGRCRHEKRPKMSETKFDDGKICAFYQVMQGYVVYRKDGRSNIYY
jgi:hypothetical protein